MGQGNIIGKPNLPATTGSKGLWNLREQYAASRDSKWPGYDPQWDKTTLLLKTAFTDTFTDSSTNNYTVTRGGDTSQTIFTPYEPTGYWSYHFDGAGDYLQTASNTTLNFGTGDFTIEAWINLTLANGASGAIVSGTNGGSIGFRYGTTWNGTTNGIGLYRASVADCEYITYSFQPRVWYHVAVVRQSGVIKFFVNGTQVTTQAGGGSVAGYTVPAEGNVRVGTSDNVNGDHFNGFISNLRVTKSAVYTTNFTTPTAPLTAVANTTLLTCQDNRFKDNSTNNFTLTKNGDVAVSSFGPFGWEWSAASGGAAYFDGTGDFLSAPNAAANFTNQNFTAEAWVWFTTNSIGYQPVMMNTGTGDYQGWIFYIESNNTLTWGWSANGSGWSGGINTSYVPVINAWTHLAAVRNGATVTIYANGVSLGTHNIGSNSIHSPSGVFYAGYYPYFPGGARSLTGFMANIRLVTGTALYTSNFTPPTAPLTAVSGTTLLLNTANVTSTNWYDTGTGRPIRSIGVTPRALTAPSGDLTSTYFDGGTSYLTTPTNPVFNFGGDFTIEGWLYPTVTTGTDRCIWETRASAGDAGMVVFINSSGQLSTYTSNAIRITSTASLTANTWQHVALVRSNGTMAFYINGTQSGTLAYSTAITNPGAPRIGIRFDNAVPYTGFISNFRVLNGTAAYTGTFTPSRLPHTQTATTALILNQALSVWDATGRNALNNTGTVVATPNMFTGSALSLNGSQVARAHGALSTNFAFGTGDFTIEAWIYPTSTSNSRAIFSTRGTSSTAVWFGLENGTYTLYFYTNAAVVSANTAVPANAWSHVALVRSSGVAYIYINGTCVGSGASTTNLTDSTAAIGYSASENNWYWIGQIDELRVTKAARYLGNFTPTTTPFDRDWEPPYNDTLVTSNVLQVKSIDLPGATNNVFRDDSVNNFLPVRYGDVTQGSFSPYIPSGYWSYQFDGSGDWLSVPNNAAFSLGAPSGNANDFTVEFWCFPTSTAVTSPFGTTYSGNNFWAFAFNKDDGNSNVVGMTNFFLTDSFRVQTPAGALRANKWSHVAATRSGTTIRLFIDGMLVASGTSSIDPAPNGPLLIGRDTNLGRDYAGSLSNLRIVKGTALYTANFTPPTSPLTAISGTTFLTGQDNRFIDRSTNNFALTRNGDVSVSRFDPFPLTVPVTTVATTNPGSVYFDGTDDRIEVAANNAFLLGSGNFTHEFWIKTTRTSTSWVTGYGVSNPTAGNQMSYLVVLSGGTFYFDMVSGGGTETLVSYGTTAQISDGNWHHLAVTREGNTVRTFRDGTLSQTITYTATIQDPGSGTPIYRVGGISGTYERPYDGSISNLRLVKGTALYTASFTPPTAPLTATANTSLLICRDPGGFTDASTNNFTVTKYGDAAAREDSPFQTAKRATYTYSGSGYFDGTGDYLTIPDNAALQMGTGSFTWEFWHYPTTFSGFYVTLIDKGYTAAGALLFQSNGADKLVIYASGSPVITSSISINPGSWYHIALVRNGTTLTLYINGVSAGSATNSTDFNSNSQMVVGANSAGAATLGQYPTYGYLSGVRVVKGTAVYTANFTPPTSPVTAISGTSLLLNFDNAGVYDATGQHVLRTAGSAASSTAQRKNEITSLYFDGTSGGFVSVPHPSPNLALGTGDFCIEFWAYRTVSAQQIFYGHRPTSTQGAYPVIYCEGATLFYYVNGGNQINGGSLATGQWYHIAVCRAASQTRMFVNGTQVGATLADTTSYLNPTGRPMIGGNDFSTNNTTDYRYTGYIEGLRVSRVGRYVANFSVPSEPFPIA